MSTYSIVAAYAYSVQRLSRPATPNQCAAYLTVTEVGTEREARREAEQVSGGGETVEVWREGKYGPTVEAIYVDGEEVSS